MTFFTEDIVNTELLNFLDESPNAFFAVENIRRRLADQEFIQLYENHPWNIKPGGKYYVTRNSSSIIAFMLPDRQPVGFNLIASHCDSPVFRVKTNAEVQVENHFIRLNVEKYGGMIFAPWLDRPLSVAGRVILRTREGLVSKLVNIDRDLLLIPNLAIHMDREVNKGHAYNPQTEMLPLFSMGSPGEFKTLIAQAAEAEPEQILDADLYLYNRMKATIFGMNREFIASGRLDDLQCAFASLKGFLAAKPAESAAVYCVFDNEEVGSGTRQGAASTFLSDTLHRLCSCLSMKGEDYLCALANSFMASADNAHSVHPNYPDKADPTNRPYLNGGIVIKYSANQKYTTDAVSGAIFRQICEKSGVPYQTFHNRSDMEGGSTLGNISARQVSVKTVDIGLPQLAMHSPYETAGARDTTFLCEASRTLFSSSLAQTIFCR